MHTLTLIREHEGTEEWLCAACGRHLLIEWNPWRRVVLEAGEDVPHSGMKIEMEKNDETRTG